MDGEIMETLWSEWNPFGLMARAMGRSHREEFLNSHMRDVNLKKMVRMGMFYLYFWICWNGNTEAILLSATMLKNKLARAEKGMSEGLICKDQLHSQIPKSQRDHWTNLETKALEEGGEALSIYDVSLNHGLLRSQLICVYC